MTSENKLRKVSKKLHWGRGGRFLKSMGGIKGLVFFNASERRKNNKIEGDVELCIACGKCCKKHWRVRLTSEREIEMFGDDVVDGKFIWTDKCKFHVDDKCSIHEDKPYKCSQYFCEGNLR